MVNTPGKLIGSLDGLKPFEKTAIKTPDFFVNGVKTELKTLFPKDGVVNINTGITRIQEGFKQGAQTVIVDGRVAGLTSEQANQILNRAAGTYQNKALPGQVEIWTIDGVIRR